MRLVPTFPLVTGSRRTRRIQLTLLGLVAGLSLSPHIIAQKLASPSSTRERMHQSEQWAQIQQHLPDPATATPQALEQQADILRARRFPDDATDFYKSALARGGNAGSLLNKLGLTELEMKDLHLARAYFQRAVKVSRTSADAWNNLGAVEFLDGASRNAVSHYKHAIKLDKSQAIFHANLATAYFQTKDYDGARREIATALKLDPGVFEQQGTGGITAHVLSSQDRARFSFEMAKLYAQSGLEEQMLHSLATASESGMDVQHEMRHDAVLGKFATDPRVLVLVHNAQLMRAGHAAAVGTSTPPAPLPASAQPVAD